MHTYKRFLLTLVALLAMTAGAWAQGFEFKQLTVPETWNGKGGTINADDLPDFKTVSEDEAKAWTGAPANGVTFLIYQIDGGKQYYCRFENGAYSYSNWMGWEYYDYYNFRNNFSYYYTAAAPLVIYNDAKTEATFEMPENDATVSYLLKRDMSVDVSASIAERIRIKKDGESYVAVNDAEIFPAVLDNLDAENPIILIKDTDYELQLQKKGEGEDEWADVDPYSVGIFRWKVTGADNYSGVCYTNAFELFAGYEVTIPAGEYITYYKDEALRLDETETAAELYTVSSVNETTVTLSGPYDAMPANTPMLVKNNSSEAKTILLIPTTDPDLLLNVAPEFKGTLSAQEMSGSNAETDYYVCNGQQFVYVKNAGTVPANTCWLEVSKGMIPGVAGLRIVIGEATGIDSIDRETLTNGAWYDLNGRKFDSMPTKRGVYIMNGRKVVVK